MSNVFDTLIFEAATRHGVDPALIKAIVKAESDFDPRALRHEPHVAHLNGPDDSLGLMQTLFTTAQELGYSGPREGLFNPETSLEYGARYLKRQLVRYGGDVEKAVAAYNAGSAKRDSSGKWRNQGYVDRVLRFFREFRSIQSQQLNVASPTSPALPLGLQVPPAVRIVAGEDERGRRLIQMETVLSGETAPYILGGLALLGAFVFSGRGR